MSSCRCDMNICRILSTVFQEGLREDQIPLDVYLKAGEPLVDGGCSDGTGVWKIGGVGDEDIDESEGFLG